MSNAKLRGYGITAVIVIAVLYLAQQWGPTRDLVSGRIPGSA